MVLYGMVELLNTMYYIRMAWYLHGIIYTLYYTNMVFYFAWYDTQYKHTVDLVV